MNIYLNILLVVVSLAVIFLIVYLVQVLTQLRKTLKSVDDLTQQINTEVVKVDEAIENIKSTSDNVKNITGKVAGFSFLKGIGVVGSILKGINFVRGARARKKKREQDSEK